MCAYSLVLDFDMIQQGVKNRAPRAYGWAGAFGIMVTVVWLYLELLRIFAHRAKLTEPALSTHETKGRRCDASRPFRVGEVTPTRWCPAAST